MDSSSQGSSGGSGGSLPQEIIQSIAISNAKSIGEQPAILANLALSQQIFNQNLQQQMAISQQQAMNQVALATAASGVNKVNQSEAAPAGFESNILTQLQSINKTLSQINENIKQ
ncbi:MAG: hypothetical protein NE327_20830 [Lentisphaeraceae bacterium]|nr:hypothetical protein [Lentisphaeraceae bacterium]